MTRMIERWFPCAEVSESAGAGWGSGNQERNLFTWFAARPTSQAKAAVLCSILPWPEDSGEQRRLQQLVHDAMTDRYAAWDELRTEIAKSHPEGFSTLDPFSGRGMIPLEASRLGLSSFGIDYSPVAVLASHLLTDFPFRDWSDEPSLPFGRPDALITSSSDRLLTDVRSIVDEIAERQDERMRQFYPRNAAGEYPWGYLWAVGIHCQECGREFPLVGSYELIRARGKHLAQSFFIEARVGGEFGAVVHPGEPDHLPTLRNAILENGRKAKGKSAVCIHCQHVHSLETHRGLVNEHHARDVLLLAADIDAAGAKSFRPPTSVELQATIEATAALSREAPFTPFLPAVPSEEIRPGNNNIIGPSIYGARTYGDFMVDRQTLYYVRLARTIDGIGRELIASGNSADYARALTGYATAVVVKKLRRSTRGARFQAAGGAQVGDLFVNEGSITFSHDSFEAGLGDGPGTWGSISKNVLSVLKSLLSDARGAPAHITRGSATAIAMGDSSVKAVVTDPPYGAMIAYADASDLFYTWIKRCLHSLWPELVTTSDPYGAQDKELELIVKRQEGTGKLDVKDHRTWEFYDARIREAFKEMRRVVANDGIVTIVFGHGQPEVWQRLLHAISGADLVMTGSWPARTEAGGSHGNAHIETTLTMACRPAPTGRPTGRKGTVESEIDAEIKRRYPDWERWGLAPTDMLMASAGPAMEVVGRYREVLSASGEPVDIYTFLPRARASVQRAMALEIDDLALESFDARTRFALWWVRLYGREVQPKSELRWQTLAAALDQNEVRDLVPDTNKGVAFTTSVAFGATVHRESEVIDVAVALAAASRDGLEAMGSVLAASGRSRDDAFLWAAIKFLADRLPDGDEDAIAFTRVLRSRTGVGAAASNVVADLKAAETRRDHEDRQIKLL
jgi:putative DNA methylase